MKRYVGFSTLVVLGVGLICSQIGCQSGWKISNPFASHPRASSAEAPEELDALGDVDELTPPPENYTVGDASKSNNSESLAQKGKYEVEDKASDVEKIESETRAIAEKTETYKSQESYQVADYSQSYQTDAASTPSGSVAQNPVAQNPVAQNPASQNFTPAQPYAQTNQAVSQSYVIADQAASQQYSPANQPAPQSYAQTSQEPTRAPGQTYAQNPANSGFQAYSAPMANADVATNAQFGRAQNAPVYNNGAGGLANVGTEFPTPDFQAASSIADGGFPTTDASFPVVQNTNAVPTSDFPAASFSAAPSSSQPINVALNPESSVVVGATPSNSQPATYSTGATTDSDPYSDVYYAPQTTSSGAGFAPGSASGLY